MKVFYRSLALIAALITSPAYADWTGCYVGGGVGYSMSSTAVDYVDSGVTLIGLDGVSSSGFDVAPIVGCDVQGGRVVIGGFADYAFFSDHDATATLFGTSIDLVSLQDQWTIGGRLGYLVNDSTLVYGLLGYSQADIEGIAGEFIASTLDGYSVGGGLETELGGGFYGRIEYRYTDFREESLTVGKGEHVEMDTDLHAVRASLTYKLGPNLFSAK